MQQVHHDCSSQAAGSNCAFNIHTPSAASRSIKHLATSNPFLLTMLFPLLLLAAFRAASTAPTLTTAGISNDHGTSFTILGRETALPSCVDPGRYRTMQEIVWHCIATIFACTWVAFHPNVPDPRFSRWKRIWRNGLYLTLALIAPEFVTIRALKQCIGAGQHRDKYNKKYCAISPLPRTRLQRFKNWLIEERPGWRGDEGGYLEGRREEDRRDGKLYEPARPTKSIHWTLTHGFLLEMGGLVAYTLDTPDFKGSQGTITDVDQLSAPFNVPQKYINDRSKRDNLTKFIAALQTSWFIVQCIARWITYLPVTQLEVVTLAFAFLNIITYALWWKKPQKMNVAFYVRVDEIHEDAFQSSEGINPFYSTVDQLSLRASIMALCFIAIPFGVIHLIPIWLSTFPTPRRKLLWMISSIWITTEPAILACLRRLEEWGGFPEGKNIRLGTTIVTRVMFGCARVILLFLAFASLRNLPAEVFYNVDWDNFIPRVT